MILFFQDTINVLKSSVEDLWRNAFPKDPPCNHLIGDIHDTKWEVFEGIKNQFAKLKVRSMKSKLVVCMLLQMGMTCFYCEFSFRTQSVFRRNAH